MGLEDQSIRTAREKRESRAYDELRCVWTKARSTLALPVWHCRGYMLQRDTLGFIRVKLPICAAYCSGTGLRSRNSQTCTTRFRISELGNLVQSFRHFRYGVSVRLTNHSYWDSCLRWFMGFKIMFILIETSPGLGIIARRCPLPISMVFRPE